MLLIQVAIGCGWAVGDSGTILFYNSSTDTWEGNLQYDPSKNIAQSKTISGNVTSAKIGKATIYANQILDGQTVEYKLSANGGANWEAVTLGVELTFANPGNDLRWKAILGGTATSTPVIDDISIDYSLAKYTINYSTWKTE